MDDLEDYKYFSYDKVNGILFHEVSAENFTTEAEFVESMSYFAVLIEQYQPKCLVIKIFKKPDYFELGLNDFMKTTVYKAIHESGLKKIAFYFSNEIFYKELDEVYSQKINLMGKELPVQVKFFSDLESAKAWTIMKD